MKKNQPPTLKQVPQAIQLCLDLPQLAPKIGDRVLIVNGKFQGKTGRVWGTPFTTKTYLDAYSVMIRNTLIIEPRCHLVIIQ